MALVNKENLPQFPPTWTQSPRARLYWEGKRLYRYFNPGIYYPLHRAPKGDFVFIHIEKTGGTSITHSLGLPHIVHYTARQTQHLIGARRWRRAFKFTIVRNPWDKVVSQYKFRIKSQQNRMHEQHISFHDWVRRVYTSPVDTFYHDDPRMFYTQIDWLKDKNGVMDIDFVGRFEQLESDFGAICAHLGIEASLAHLKSTDKVNYREFYDDETRQIVADWYKEDIIQFGYTW